MFPNRKKKLTLEQAKQVMDKVIADAKEKLGITIELTEPVRADLAQDYYSVDIQTEPRFTFDVLEEQLDTLFKDEDKISFQLCGGTADDGTLLGLHNVLIFDDLEQGFYYSNPLVVEAINKRADGILPLKGINSKALEVYNLNLTHAEFFGRGIEVVNTLLSIDGFKNTGYETLLPKYLIDFKDLKRQLENGEKTNAMRRHKASIAIIQILYILEG